MRWEDGCYDVVILEQDEQLRVHWQDALETQGLKVIADDNAKDLVDQMSSRSFSLLVLDAELPGANVNWLAHLFMALSPSARIVLTARHVHPYGWLRKADLPVLVTLQKPLDVNELVRIVRTVLPADGRCGASSREAFC